MALPSKPHLLLLLLLPPIVMLPSLSHQAQDPRVIDRIVRDSAFQSYHTKHHKTAIAYKLPLPSSLSAVAAETVRYRAGSLRRYGAAIKEFRVAPGVFVHPHIKRLIVVRQNLGNLSAIYNAYGNISGFQLVSPVLGLLFYNAAGLRNSSSKNLSELEILVARRPIAVDFSRVVGNLQRLRPLCAMFELDGNVSLSNQTASNKCLSRRQGHFALVIESAKSENSKVSEWKVVVVSVVAGAFVTVLLGLMVVAVASARRKRYQREEMERRAYEEEALQISMVGHVRAPTASVARTAPALENDYAPSSS
ncbi:uncharacterized protein [Elaeis guineensis]|uniref:Uncharacterized protein LOC105043530 n=1 Tax=Elaeis guineensis var. tenera TaxID=51953 RepID=A0A6I9R2K6_ELAGV|nr:uncharacterized protein LOC105043530 [Elaeis guineensis]